MPKALILLVERTEKMLNLLILKLEKFSNILFTLKTIYI